ncbi:MAG: tRNA (adenosine(37)-N6)-dimethylallyltransferase MiaA [Bifidobacteriaceae bacterium]|jgi:tRNA dimethylallyltransferase|nr:tRNA (adenosine(37)-N6)-dimethylallyltransferase MiaA [Bifidobacteriaceae bacterium]
MKSILAVVGCTASGKTEYALNLARLTKNAVLINADAFALYRQMNVGTSKPSDQDLAGIENYMFNVLDVNEIASVSIYRSKVLKIIEQVSNQGKTIILVGGSGLYVRSALDQMDFPPTDHEVRKRLYNELEADGVQKLYERLGQISPASIKQISPHNSRKIIRALEIIELTGVLPKLTFAPPQYLRPTRQIAFCYTKEELKVRIHRRTKKMLEDGLVEEVFSLKNLLSATSQKAIGYIETLQYLAGQIDQDQLIDLINLHTFQLVKKQLTWFKKDTRINWQFPDVSP